jgi:hypothetical protein
MIQKNNGVVLDFIDTTLMTSHNRSNFYWCNSNNASFRIGGPWWGGDPQFFTGKLDDIGVWNRALTNQEILELYLSQQCQISITSQPLNQVTAINSTADFAIYFYRHLPLAIQLRFWFPGLVQRRPILGGDEFNPDGRQYLPAKQQSIVSLHCHYPQLWFGYIGYCHFDG